MSGLRRESADVRFTERTVHQEITRTTLNMSKVPIVGIVWGWSGMVNTDCQLKFLADWRPGTC